MQTYITIVTIVMVYNNFQLAPQYSAESQTSNLLEEIHPFPRFIYHFNINVTRQNHLTYVLHTLYPGRLPVGGSQQYQEISVDSCRMYLEQLYSREFPDRSLSFGHTFSLCNRRQLSYSSRICLVHLCYFLSVKRHVHCSHYAFCGQFIYIGKNVPL